MTVNPDVLDVYTS